MKRSGIGAWTAGIFFVAILIHVHPVNAQVNTETYRRTTDVGFSQSYRVHFNYLAGNSESLELKPRYRIDYADKTWSAFGVGEVRYGNRNGINFVNQGFIHGRFMKQINADQFAEVFIQKEYDDFRRVTDRRLLGVNIRSVLPTQNTAIGSVSAGFGIGVMGESETNTLEGPVTLLRLNSYLTAAFEIPNLQWNATVYIQPAFRDFTDARVLLENTVTAFLPSSNIGFSTSLRLFYDSQPPVPVKPMDL
ncbi:DUF481 domain-containing protein, partial [bacterium]|nr:DUF481 domain-containing protein [bacterium]